MDFYISIPRQWVSTMQSQMSGEYHKSQCGRRA